MSSARSCEAAAEEIAPELLKDPEPAPAADHSIEAHLKAAAPEDIVELCDREADLLNRGRSVESMVNLRRRLTSLFRQFVDTPEFNPEADRFLKVPGVRLMNTLPE